MRISIFEDVLQLPHILICRVEVPVASSGIANTDKLVAELLIARTGWPLVSGALIALIALGVLPVLLTMPEAAFRDPLAAGTPT